jgi:hypothetical protein
VPADPVLELGQLALAGQLAVDEQVRDLDERRLLGELLDRVAPVAQDPGVAVDVRDGALARRGVDEAGVVGDSARVLEQRCYPQCVGTVGGGDARKGEALVLDGELGLGYVAGHRGLPPHWGVAGVRRAAHATAR